jgi:hypothetical protein
MIKRYVAGLLLCILGPWATIVLAVFTVMYGWPWTLWLLVSVIFTCSLALMVEERTREW